MTRTQRLITAGLLAALAIALSVLEGLLPPLPIPGAKLGLANVTVMFALYAVSWPCAGGIVLAKAVFALLRGPIACLMSAVGGVLSLLAMALARRLWGDKLSFIGIGVIGAFAHNVGQWTAAYCLLGSAMVYYAPILLLLAIPFGILTGLVLNAVFPYLQKNPFVRKG